MNEEGINQKTVQTTGIICIQLEKEDMFRTCHKCPFIISAYDWTLNNLHG